MDRTFVRINGVYICPECGKEHDISGNYEADESLGSWDSGNALCVVKLNLI